MNNVNKSLLLIAILGMPTSVLGSCFVGPDWVFGLDYYQAWRGVKGNQKRILPKSFPGGTLYVSGRWICLGFELGYDASIRAKKSWTLASGTRIGNFIASNTMNGTSRVRFNSLHFDLLGYLPLSMCGFEFFGAIGYGSASGVRLGGGLNYMFTECLGLRAKVGYEYNATIRVANNTLQNTLFNRKPFTHAGTFSLGAFVRF